MPRIVTFLLNKIKTFAGKEKNRFIKTCKKINRKVAGRVIKIDYKQHYLKCEARMFEKGFQNENIFRLL